MDAQDQGQGFDIQNVIQSLVQMLGPQEADAATRRPSAPVANQVPQQATPVSQPPQLPPVPNMPQQPNYTGMNVPQAMTMRNQLVNQQIAQQKLQLAQQKAQPQDVGQRLAQILGGGNASAQTPDVLFRGVTPGTGTPYFSNFNAPEGYAPEAQRQQFMQDYQARQDAMAKANQPAAGGLDPKRLALHAELVQGLTKAGYSPTQAGDVADAAFPDVASAVAAGKPGKALTPDQMGKLWKYNPQTRDFDPVPPELTHLPAQQLEALGYRSVTDKARAQISELDDVHAAFDQLKSAVQGASGKSALELGIGQLPGGSMVVGPEGARFKKASTNFTTIFDKFLGGVRGGGSPAMQAIRSEVLPKISSSNELSDALMQDLGALIDTMEQSRVKAVVGGQAAGESAQTTALASKVLQDWRTTGPLRAAAQPRMGAAGSSAPATPLRTPGNSQRLPNGVTFRWKD